VEADFTVLHQLFVDDQLFLAERHRPFQAALRVGLVSRDSPKLHAPKSARAEAQDCSKWNSGMYACMPAGEDYAG
jgi:hypothetical protein